MRPLYLTQGFDSVAMKKFVLTLLLTLFSFGLFTQPAQAQQFEQCNASVEGDCVSGGICTKIVVPKDESPTGYELTYFKVVGTCGGGNLGRVEAPEAISRLNLRAGIDGGAWDYSGIGILIFLNRLITLVNVIAGIIVMFNVVTSGWIFLTSWGKPDAFTQVRDKLTLTFIGVAVIAFSYTIAGVLGLIFFQDATAIINPTLCSPGSTDPICSF